MKIAYMKHILHAVKTQQRQIFQTTCLVVVCCGLTGCMEPQDKPIPPLDPSLSTVETPAAVVETPSSPGTITRMPLGTLYQLTQGNAALIFDVRPLIYYKMGHIPGAISFPKENFDKDIAKNEALIKSANKNQKPVVVYCTDLACPDARTVATQLSDRGHNVAVLQGGYDAWKIATD